MAFASYDEFRLAVADPTRCYNVQHQVDTNALTYNVYDADMVVQRDLFVTNADVSTGGALLNHTSTLGTPRGLVGVPLRKPSVPGRSWHLYNVELAMIPQATILSMTLFDALWYGTFAGSNSILDYPVSNFPTLTRSIDGRDVYARPLIQPINIDSNNTVTFTGETYSGGLRNDSSFYRREHGSSNYKIMGQPGRSPLLFSAKQALYGRGGFKTLTNINFEYPVGGLATWGALLVKEVLSFPIPQSRLGNILSMRLPLFNSFKPFVVLPPGTDGNYACLFFGVEVGSENSDLIPQGGTIRLQFVEG